MKKTIFCLMLTVFSLGIICSCSKDEQIKIIAKSVSLDKETASLCVDASLELVATVLPKESIDKNIVWSSSDETLATVDDNGVVKAVKTGVVEITATTVNHISTKCVITIVDKVISCAKIMMDKSTASIVEESTLQLIATILPKECTENTLVWTSSKISVATVDAQGLVKAVKAGETEIIATTSNGLKAKCVLSVTNNIIAVTEVIINNQEEDLTVGKTLQLITDVLPKDASLKDLVFISSSEGVATVSNTGLIRAVKVGKVKITVKSELANISAVLELDIIPVDEIALKHIQDLKASSYGWKAVYAGNNKTFGAFNYLIKFNDELMSVETDMINAQKEGDYTYEIRADIIAMGPESPFCKLFILEDDNDNNLKIDFVFNIEETTENSIKLVGVQFKTVLLLEKASAVDIDYINLCNAQALKMKAFGKSNISEKFFKILKLTGAVDKLIEVDFASWIYTEDLRTVSFNYMDGDNVVSKSLQYVYTPKGFELVESLEIEGKKIFNFEYDETAKTYKVVDANGVEGNISFSDEKAFVRKGIALEFKSKAHQVVTMANSTLATEVYKNGAACNFFMGGEVAIFMDYLKDGKTINSIMLQNSDKGIRTLDVIWTIEGEDFIKASIVDQEAVDKMKLTDGEKVIIDYYLKGFYILPYSPIMGYDTYLMVAKENSAMALGAFMMETKK